MIKKIKENKVYCEIVLVVFTMIFLKAWDSIDNDFFHIAYSGKWIVEHKSIMYYNETFVLDGYKTIIQQWLYSILLYGSYALFGTVGIKLFTTIQLLILVIVMFKLLQQFKIDKRTSIFAIAVSLITMGYINCRPQMISLILLYSQLIILEKYKNTDNKKVLYLLPLITLAEINLHCTFWVFHFIFLLPYIVPLNKIFKGKLQIEDTVVAVKPLIIPMILMVVSLLINPYGIKAITCLFYSSTISLLEIDELQQINIFSEQMIYFMVGIILCVMLYVKNKLTSTTFYFTIGTGVLFTIAERNSIFYSVAILYSMKDLLKKLKLNRFYDFLNSTNKKEEKIVTGVTFASAILILLLLVNKCLNNENSNSSNDNFITPSKAVKYLEQNEEDLSKIRMFTEFNSGSFFLWNGIGKIYFEPKTEPYIEEINGVKDIVTEYAYLKKCATYEDIKKFLNEYDFDYLYVPAMFTSLQVYLESSDEYECVVVGSNYEGLTNYEDYDIAQYRLYKHIR